MELIRLFSYTTSRLLPLIGCSPRVPACRAFAALYTVCALICARTVNSFWLVCFTVGVMLVALHPSKQCASGHAALVPNRPPPRFILSLLSSASGAQAMRDMADTDDDKDPVAVAEAADDRHARAAQVLAAVVSGLTSTPKELSAKHRSNRGAGPAKAGAGVVATAAASPAIQKIRDYQLQVLFAVCAPPAPRHVMSMAAAFIYLMSC